MPYAVEAQTEYLGYVTHASVDRATARDFAETALKRATSMCEVAMASADGGAAKLLPVGLAVTASLATNRTRRGANRALVATAIGGKVTLFEHGFFWRGRTISRTVTQAPPTLRVAMPSSRA